MLKSATGVSYFGAVALSEWPDPPVWPALAALAFSPQVASGFPTTAHSRMFSC